MENENSFELEKEIEELDTAIAPSDLEADNIAEDAPVESTQVEEQEPPAPSEAELQKKERKRARRKICKVFYIIMLSVVGAFAIIATMVGAILLAGNMISEDEVVDIDESFELEDLTDIDIIGKDEYFIADNYKYITNGFDYSEADYDYDLYDRAECYFEADNFSGIRTVSVSCASDSHIILTIKAVSDASEDDVKVVITSEREIIATLNANEPMIYTVDTEGAEHIFVKIIGDQANVSITVTRTIIGFDESPDL